MDELIETVRQLDAKIQQLLQSKNMNEVQFLRMYAKSKSVQIAFAMGSRSMATMMADSILKQMEEEE
jgi:cell division protein YceG involved in septum cleavage